MRVKVLNRVAEGLGSECQWTHMGELQRSRCEIMNKLEEPGKKKNEF